MILSDYWISANGNFFYEFLAVLKDVKITTETYQKNIKCYFNLQVRFKQTKNIENLKTDLTTRLQPSIGPFRHIYTPAGGTEVTSLDQIQKDKEYVAGI